MLSYPTRIKDHVTDRKLRELIDAINNLQGQADSLDSGCKKIHVPTMAEIQTALQQGGTNPLNLTGLQPPCPPGTVPATTSFSDPLTTIDPNSGTGLGANWIHAIQGHGTPITNNVAWMQGKIAPSSKDSVNALIWEVFNTTGASTTLFTLAIPAPIYVSSFGKTQFCQCTLVQAGADATGTYSGVMVCGYGAQSVGPTGYYFQVGGDHSWALKRINTYSDVTTYTSGSGMADGDVYRITADFSIGGQITLTINRNGSALASHVDSTGSRLTFGSPCLVGVQPGVSVNPKGDWRTFSAGQGL